MISLGRSRDVKYVSSDGKSSDVRVTFELPENVRTIKGSYEEVRLSSGDGPSIRCACIDLLTPPYNEILSRCALTVRSSGRLLAGGYRFHSD